MRGISSAGAHPILIQSEGLNYTDARQVLRVIHAFASTPAGIDLFPDKVLYYLGTMRIFGLLKDQFWDWDVRIRVI